MDAKVPFCKVMEGGLDGCSSHTKDQVLTGCADGIGVE